ncbi:MAG: GNAT family N-acetyltransferase [Rhizobiales bacterium]|nr:GNAT family N-acetyltransferase [Hyphomicrobiales bacterium]
MDRLAALPQASDLAGVAPLSLETVSALPANTHISLVTTLAGLRALEKDWLALEANSQGATTVFQSFAWISTWCRIYCAGESGAGIHIIAGHDQNRLVFLWPLMLTRRAGLNVLCWITEPFGQYGDILCAKGQNSHLWVGNALRFIRRLKGIDLLRLRHVRDDSAIACCAATELVNAHLDERAPYLDLTQFASEADYENRYTGTQRKRRKKIRKHLEEMGDVTFTRLTLGSDADKAITEALAEKNKWLSQRGRINQVLSCPFHGEFLKALARSKLRGVEMVVTELRAGDRAISWEISFRFGTTHFAYITSHANDLTDLSPGRLHFDLSQRACLADGMKTFDLMVPFDPHKESWSSACMPTQDYYLPMSRKGMIAGTLYLSHIRPRLRSLYYRLPQALLRYINPLRRNAEG